MKTATILYKICRQAYQRDYGMYPMPFYEVKVIQGEHEYSLHELVSVKISQALTTNSGLDVGNANSSVCHLTVKESSDNWERMAQFTVQFRMVKTDSNITSEWITAGVFWTDERSEDTQGNLVITGYDAMLMLEKTWADKIPQALLPANFPITAKAWATMIQNAELANFADLTQLDDTVAFVGLSTSATIRDTLKSIAAVHAGNWTILGTDTLTLVPYVNVSSSETTKFVTLGYDGIQATQFTTTPAFDAVSGVHLETEAGTVMEAGDDTGYRMKSICSVSTTAGVAALCLSKIEDYVYKPFTATNARIDPLVDLGDSVQVGEEIYQIMSLEWNFSKMVTALVSAPYDQEIDHEYTVPSPETKTYRKTLSLVDDKMGEYVPYDQFATAIEQNEQAVVLAASHTYVTQTLFNQEISAIQSQLDGSIQTWSGNAVPTLNNAPASSWTTAALKAEHVGDTYFVNSDAGIPEAGNYYRFEENNGVYSWQLLTDSALTEALAKAAEALAAAEDAQETADESLAEVQMKGRIFVAQPTDAQAYSIGDLWVNATYGSTYSNDVLKCKTAKAAGDAFNIAHWEKASKYTDDAAVNTLRQEVEAEFLVQADNIAAKVSRTGGTNAANSFSWQLNDTGHRWFANGSQDPVVSITGTGLAVKGEINATSGYIGNGSSGFTIGNTSIYNGVTSMSDTSHYGVYLGTDGISLGKGAFKVTNTGELYAQSGTFEGNVYAKNIDYGGNYGTLSGAGITPYTIGDSNIARAGDYGALTTASLSSGVQGSLALADNFGLATTQNSAWYPSYFRATSIKAVNGSYAGEFYVDFGDESTLTLSNHYHQITANNDGTVTIGAPYNSNTPPSFNIADTHFYRDAVSAVTIASGNVVATTGSNVGSYSTGFDFDLTNYLYTPPASPNIAFGRIEILNASGTLLKRIRVQVPNNTTSVTVTGASGLASDSSNYTTYDLAASFAASSIYDSGNTLYARTQVTLSNGVTSIIRAAIPDTSGSVTTQSITGITTDSTDYTTYDLTVNRSAAQIYTTSSYQYGRATITLSNGNTSTIRMRMPNQSSSVTMSSVTGLTTSSTDYTTYDFTVSRGASTLYTSGSYTYGRATIALSNGNTSTLRFRVPASSGTISSITVTRDHDPDNYDTIRECMPDWDLSVSGKVYINVKLEAKNSSGTVLSTATGKVNATDIAGFFSTVSATVLATTTSSANNNYDVEVDTTGFTNAFYKSGSYQFVRFQFKNEEGDNLDIVRVKMASTDTAISEVLALTSTSSTYTTYDRQVSFAASSIYTPSGSSTEYARVQVNLNNGTHEVIRVALPASVTVTDIESHCTSQDYSDYWQNSLGQWMLKVRAMNGSTQLYEKSLNIQHAVNYGGTLSWDIHQHYDMGQADGWDCVVTTGSGQQHTFWSPSRIYQ